MKRSVFVVAAVSALSITSGVMAADTGGVIYQPPATWVLDPPAVEDGGGATDAALRFAYFDNQVRIADDGAEQDYTAYRLKILKPEGLGVGNISLTWQPDTGAMTVHYVRLIRNGQTTDLLASTKFIVLQREGQLEQSVLTGQRTATLQAPGLQVGDEIALAATVDKRDAGLMGRAAGLAQLPVVGTPGVFRFRLLWPTSRATQWRATKDMSPIQPTRKGAETALDVTLKNPSGAIPTEDAPDRYNMRRLIEYSDFTSWPDTSRQLALLFDRAAVLDPGSPIKAEAEAIAAGTRDPTERAQAALQLVEDRIRYVFIALNGGSYIPATADETWRRRFGDCKAKTVLLVALLRELGIDAEPALVNTKGGDGSNERLPGPRIFDHVIARAVVSGKVAWLDGTRLGDRHLDNIPLPYRWALPLTPSGAALEKIEARDTGFPSLTSIVDIDATAGVDHDAQARFSSIIRGDTAFILRTTLAGMTADDADRALKTYWRQQADWITPDKVSWSYDERRGAIRLELVGSGNPGWKTDSAGDHSLMIIGAGFNPPDPLRRPKDQDQSAPWSVEFPHFNCWATTIRLPKARGNSAWSLYAEPMSQRLGGVLYWRKSGKSNNVVRTVMSRRSYESEATPAEAQTVNRAIPDFNNNMSSISEDTEYNVVRGAPSHLPFEDNTDWLNAPTACSPIP